MAVRLRGGHSQMAVCLRRGHSQKVNDRPRAGLAVAYGQEGVFLDPGEKAELQWVYFLIFTILKLNSVLNIENMQNVNKTFNTTENFLNEGRINHPVYSQHLIIWRDKT